MPPPPPAPPPPPQVGTYLVPDDDFADGAVTPGTPGLRAPIAVRRVHPRYTSGAMRARIEGRVVTQIIVEADGTVGKARVVGPLDPDLDEQALTAVRQWTFRPGLLDGTTVPVVVVVELEFRLH